MKTFSFVFLSLAVIASTGSAAILVSYNFDNGTGAPGAMETEAVPGNLIPSGGISTGGQPAIFPVVTVEGTPYGWVGAPSANIAGTNAANPGSETLAVSSGDYFSFTITPTTGNGFNFTTLTFGTGFYVVGGGTFALHGYFFVRSSIDNYATTISSVFEATHQTIAAGQVPTFGEAFVDLSDPRFQGVAGPVTFRIYVYDDSNAATRYVSLDNIMLTGDLVPVIPEPSTCALSLIAASAFITRRRRL